MTRGYDRAKTMAESSLDYLIDSPSACKVMCIKYRPVAGWVDGIS